MSIVYIETNQSLEAPVDHQIINNERVGIMEFVFGIVISALIYFIFLQSFAAAKPSPSHPVLDELVPSQQPISDGIIRPAYPTATIAETDYQNLPQDSVLRRHHLAHVRYLIDEVTFPRPTESVLRRHYDQLIESELDKCLKSDAHMQKLISRYEAYKQGYCR